MKQNIKAACIQMSCIPCDIQSNLEKAEKLIREAKNHGAELVILPELFNIGYDLHAFQKLQYCPSQTILALSKLSKELGITILAGIAQVADNQQYNSAVVFDSLGVQTCTYNKMNLFPLSQEKSIFNEGTELGMFTLNGFKCGIMICYDIRFPELAAKYIEEGCTAFIVVSAFPFPRLEHWQILLRARAIENQVYVLATNRTGKDGEFSFLGNSCVIDPWGTPKALLNESEEGVLLYEISMDKINEVRTKMPCLDNKARLSKLFGNSTP